MSLDKIIDDLLEEFKDAPIDMLGTGKASSEHRYLCDLRASYMRTVCDIDTFFGYERTGKRILELGAYLGVVSIALKRLGYDVDAADIPEFHESSRLRSRYERNKIPFHGINLRSTKLPHESDSLDAVIMCEVMEHLNFNPLPVLQEINRVLKKDGLLYVAMPNQAYLVNRKKLFFGKSIHPPIDDYFRQLDRRHNMIVGLHWREYTMSETVRLAERMGFEVARKYYYRPSEKIRWKNAFSEVRRRILYAYPPFRPYQVVLGRKVSIPECEFWRTDANS